MLFLDTETRGRVELPRLGAYRYWKDPDSEIIMIGWMDEEMPNATWVSMDDLRMPTLRLRERITDGEPIVVHNLQFEQLGYLYHLQKRLGWPIGPNFVHDTAAMARAMGLPAHLDTLAKCIYMNMGSEPEGKDMVGRQQMLKFCKPGRNGQWYWDDEGYKVLGRYCAKDVELTRDVFGALRPLDEQEMYHMHLTEQVNERGVKIDMELAEALAGMAMEEVEDLNQRMNELTDGAVPTVSKVSALKVWLHEQTGQDFPTANAAYLREIASEESSYSQLVKDVAHLRLMGGKTSVSKIQKMIDAADPETHEIQGMFLHNGAGKTGRWSSKIVQLHNMPRAGYGEATESVIAAVKAGGASAMRLLFANVMDELPKLIRSLLIARPGKQFICGDFAGVEARLLVWLAGAEDKLKAYHNGEDIYMQTAQDIGYTGERQLGKTCELALGYQGGVVALESMAAKFGVQLSALQSQHIVTRWREKNKEVVAFWAAVWETANDAMKRPGTTQHVIEDLNLSYIFDKKHLWCRLPSGRLICNPFCQRVFSNNPLHTDMQITAVTASRLPSKDATSWPKIDLYGGLLVENIIQGIGADLLRWAIKTLEETGYPVVLHVHDEFTVEVPHTTTVEQVSHALSILPDWARGLPFDISYWTGSRYRK
jgi:DNA polymerase